ncbi:hypothetical protein RZO55_03710 [Clostridium boliviensis]|uniref:Uncharacterized protein n=1 Tax=Clostridium boliviensis TaxID=318465 RepID=A0ABU4GGD5_9CLOT|nr:hypothetical protein [Clostridium boliviensis]MDW2796684.1 hypothetical protein [Clostridium boliviensis]
MESFNLLPLIIIILSLVLISSCLILFSVIKRVKWGWLWTLTILIIIMGGIKIYNRIVNNTFHDFKAEMCDLYPEIDTIKLDMSYRTRSGSIDVYIKDGADDKIIDKMFLDILYKINNEPMSSYLKGSSNYKNKSWVNLDIFFYGQKYSRYSSGPYKHTDWFTDGNKQEQTWENSDTGKIYNYSDYMR